MSNREPLVIQRYDDNRRHLRSEASVLDPRRLLAILRRQWLWVFIPPAILAAIGASLASRQPSRYEATTMIVLQPTAAQDRLSGDRSNALAEREIKTEQELLNGPAMAAEVRTTIGADVEFDARVVEATDLIELTAVAGEPQAAASAADSIADLYLRQRRGRIETDLEAAAADLQVKIGTLEEELQSVDAALRLEASNATGLLTEADLQSADPAMVRRRSRLEGELSAAEVSLEELLSEVALTNGDVRIASPSIPPEKRISPNPVRSGVLWAMLGVLVGLGLAWMRDVLDRRIRTTDDISLLAGDLEFAGRILKPDTTSLIGPASLLIEDVADRFRVLASNSLQGNDEPVTIQVTGVRGGEGATFVAANLAATLAAGGWATVVVDADLAGGDLHRVFEVEARPGTQQLLDGQALAGVVQLSKQVHGLGVISKGSRTTSEATLHNSTLGELLKKLTESFDVVIVDGPPILNSGDAAVLAHHVDKTILVAALNRTTQPELELAAESVATSGGRVTGIALTEPTQSIIRAHLRAITSQPEPDVGEAPEITKAEALATVTGSHLRPRPIEPDNRFAGSDVRVPVNHDPRDRLDGS